VGLVFDGFGGLFRGSNEVQNLMDPIFLISGFVLGSLLGVFSGDFSPRPRPGNVVFVVFFMVLDGPGPSEVGSRTKSEIARFRFYFLPVSNPVLGANGAPRHQKRAPKMEPNAYGFRTILGPKRSHASWYC
jgi:hypothetical protein